MEIPVEVLKNANYNPSPQFLMRIGNYVRRYLQECEWTIVIGSLFLLQLQALDTSAQVLNQQINALLANTCVGLGARGISHSESRGAGTNGMMKIKAPHTEP
jgi:hypothetical protein